MRRKLAAAATAAVALLGIASPSLGVIVIVSEMSNANEPPAGSVVPTASTGGPRPASFGTATFTINDTFTQMSMVAVVNNIDVTGNQTPNDTNDNLTNAHIHASDTVTPTTTAGVVWGFHGLPFHNNNPADGVLTPFATGVGGTFTGTWDLPEGNGGLAGNINRLITGRAYINFHTAQFGGGEIRGTIPEPASAGLLCAAAVGLTRRRRR
jgi:hypothetical protein